MIPAQAPTRNPFAAHRHARTTLILRSGVATKPSTATQKVSVDGGCRRYRVSDGDTFRPRMVEAHVY
jgi:hypothetical protein